MDFFPYAELDLYMLQGRAAYRQMSLQLLCGFSNWYLDWLHGRRCPQRTLLGFLSFLEKDLLQNNHISKCTVQLIIH